MIFTTNSIYFVENGSVEVRGGDVELSGQDWFVSAEEMKKPLLASGLNRDDLFVFAELTDLDGSSEQAYVVTDCVGRESIIVPDVMVEKNAQTYMNPDLARKILSVPLEEIDQFSLSALYEYAERRYQGLV